MRTYSATKRASGAARDGRPHLGPTALDHTVAVNLAADDYARLTALAKREDIPVGRAARYLIKVALADDPS